MNKGFDIIKVQTVTNLTKEQKDYLNRVGMLEWIFRVKMSGVKNDPWFYLGLIDNSSSKRSPCYRCKYDLCRDEPGVVAKIDLVDGDIDDTCGVFCNNVFNKFLDYLKDKSHPVTETQLFKDNNLMVIFLSDDFIIEDSEPEIPDLTKPIISLVDLEREVCSTFCPPGEINLCEKCWEKAEFCVIKNLLKKKL